MREHNKTCSIPECSEQLTSEPTRAYPLCPTCKSELERKAEIHLSICERTMKAVDERLAEAKRKKASPEERKFHQEEWNNHKRRLEEAAEMVVVLQADLDLNIFQPIGVQLVSKMDD
jgi:uncharacterized protein YlaI